MSRIVVADFPCARDAKGLVIRRARVISVASLPEQIEADLAWRRRYKQVQVAGCARAQRLEAGFGAPFRAQPVLHRRPEGVSEARLLDLGAIARVDHDKCLRADRPPRRNLRTGERMRHITGATLAII